jgi:hypothetical protein
VHGTRLSHPLPENGSIWLRWPTLCSSAVC